jgi:glucose-6-phosphate 1-epimerase
MPAHATDFQRRYGIPNTIHFEDTPGGLVRAVISTPSAEADVYIQGAHIAHWTPRGQRPVLFTSSKSMFSSGKAIRGGVPIIFPWFGARGGGLPGPAHGFVRSADWTLDGTRLREDGTVEVTLDFTPTDVTRNLGFDGFHVRLRATLGRILEMELETRNTSDQTFSFEEALHTYFAIGDIRQASVTGLEGTTFIDKTDGFKQKKLGSEPVRIAKETDQVHLDTQSTCIIHDATWKRRIIVEKSGSESTVVWNPWIDKTAGMSDMAPEDWRQMICIETANADKNAVKLAPRETHTLRTVIRVD